MNVLFDMETGDPDDAVTLCFLIAHPAVSLRAVTVTPGTDEQIGLVRHILKVTEHSDIPVGSYRPNYDKNCVSIYYRRWLGNFESASPDDEGHKIIRQTLDEYPDLTLITGAPLTNFGSLEVSQPIHRWVAQGGFAGDNVVPPQYRLPKFNGLLFCPTYNFNGGPKQALKMLNEVPINERLLVSKNVCHGVVYDLDFHKLLATQQHIHPGYELIYKGMELYLAKNRAGKKFHDPLAACIAIDPSICLFKEVKLLRKGGKWGSEPAEGTNTFISIYADQDKFRQTFLQL
ncbi:MAG TPA: nucleoside hydrolase [Microscillaceae bacterium]|nr:nucleoside hydrolase [Microscillaceae bacterium]